MVDSQIQAHTILSVTGVCDTNKECLFSMISMNCIVYSGSPGECMIFFRVSLSSQRLDSSFSTEFSIWSGKPSYLW